MRFNSAAATLCLILFAGQAATQGPPDHEIWQASFSAAEEALQTNDTARLRDAVVGVFEQVIRMGDFDQRVPDSMLLITQGVRKLESESGNDSSHELVQQLVAIADASDALTSQHSLAPVTGLASAWALRGDYEQARELLTRFAGRAERDLGSTHDVTQTLRKTLAEVITDSGDFDAAVALLEENRQQVRRIYGARGREYAQALIFLANIHDRVADNSGTAAYLDQVAEAIDGVPLPTIALVLESAGLYESIGRYAEARSLLHGLDTPTLTALQPAIQRELVRVFGRIAYSSAVLGDGQGAHYYLGRAHALARELGDRASVGADAEIDAWLYEAWVYALAGLTDRVLAALESARRKSVDAGVETMHLRAISTILSAAGEHDRALEVAREDMERADPRTLHHANASTLIARSAALSTSSPPDLELAESALETRRALLPRGRHGSASEAVALSYVAMGRVDDALAILVPLVEKIETELGEYGISPSGLERYAHVLQRAGLVEESERILERISGQRHRLATELIALESGSTLVEESTFGFSVNLTHPNWVLTPPFNDIAAFSARFGGDRDNLLIVMPFVLPQGVTYEAAMESFSPWIIGGLGDTRPISRGNLAGYEFSNEIVSTTFRVRVRGQLVLTDSAVYLVLASASTHDSEAVEVMGTVFDRIAFSDTAPDLAHLSGFERELHGRRLNYYGDFAYQNGRLHEALSAYRSAEAFLFDLDRIGSIVHVLLELDEVEEALAKLDALPETYLDDPRTLVWRASSMLALDDVTGAAEYLGAAFARGFRGDNYAVDYVDLLMYMGHIAQAAEFLDDYGAGGRSPDIIAMQAVLYFELEDQDRVDALLTDLGDPQKSVPETAMVGALIALQRGGAEEMAAYVAVLSERNLSSSALYALLAVQQIEIEELDLAEDTVRRGLRLSPYDQDLNVLKEYLDSLRDAAESRV